MLVYLSQILSTHFCYWASQNFSFNRKNIPFSFLLYPKTGGKRMSKNEIPCPQRDLEGQDILIKFQMLAQFYSRSSLSFRLIKLMGVMFTYEKNLDEIYRNDNQQLFQGYFQISLQFLECLCHVQLHFLLPRTNRTSCFTFYLFLKCELLHFIPMALQMDFILFVCS